MRELVERFPGRCAKGNQGSVRNAVRHLRAFGAIGSADETRQSHQVTSATPTVYTVVATPDCVGIVGRLAHLPIQTEKSEQCCQLEFDTLGTAIGLEKATFFAG